MCYNCNISFVDAISYLLLYIALIHLAFHVTIKIYKNTFHSVAAHIFSEELNAYGWGHVFNMIAFSNLFTFGYTIFNWIRLLVLLRTLENKPKDIRDSIIKSISKK